MSFRQPFRAAPIKVGERYRQKQQRNRQNKIVTYLGGAALIGVLAGIGSAALSQGDASPLVAAVKPLAVSAGLMRARAPREGDYWSECDAARVAGTAPIYYGEPGYREGMDGDGDGIACEPYRGR